MFVLDALRRVSRGRLTIPPFHLGHLGFRPGLEVDSQYVEFENAQGHELTLTPFQGSRDNLFICKCIFTEQAGVVARALSTFTRLRLNVLSLESATIDRDTKHVLFCILSWAPSRYKKPIALDEGTKQKLIDWLPLLPTLDKRYIHFLEVLFLFCFDALEYEEVPGGHLHLPRVDIKLFDDFYVEKKWRPLKIFRSPANVSVPNAKFTLPSVYAELGPEAAESSRALLFSETETKALHIIFPKAGREKRFLHIGFTHQNRPGALLLIATLLQYCGFSIKTSLLRQYDIQRNVNVWETLLEHLDESINLIPERQIRRRMVQKLLFRS
jgi:acetolactate synthase small subunit